MGMKPGSHYGCPRNREAATRQFAGAARRAQSAATNALRACRHPAVCTGSSSDELRPGEIASEADSASDPGVTRVIPARPSVDEGRAADPRAMGRRNGCDLPLSVRAVGAG